MRIEGIHHKTEVVLRSSISTFINYGTVLASCTFSFLNSLRFGILLGLAY